MLREYEFTLITRPDLTDADAETTQQKYESLMTTAGGSILARTDWGVKKFTFPIKKFYRGRYVLYNFAGTPTELTEMERLLRIDENVLRHLSIAVGPVSDIEARKEELRKRAEAGNSERHGDRYRRDDQGGDAGIDA